MQSISSIRYSMADRILGMGDIVSLVEKAQEQFDTEELQESYRKRSQKTSLISMILLHRYSKSRKWVM